MSDAYEAGFDSTNIYFIAEGGTRRERAAAISAFTRKHPNHLECILTTYSETYGFLPSTYKRFSIGAKK